MVMVRNKKSGYTISLARYQPVIDYYSNSYACVGAYEGSNSVTSDASSIEINYPTRDTARKYFDVENGNQIVYDMTIMADITSDFDQAMVDMYNNQFLLEDVRIVYEMIKEVTVDKSNFRKKIIKYCVETDADIIKKGYRPSKMYTFKVLKGDVWL